ncbi:MAG: hypothetical protein R3321_00055 [Nitrososphaeraceae archaeon]|nr:hypothetical protein [Nitrososphaeraceae archaeon]
MLNCRKGYSCGAACISTLYECEQYLSEEITEPMNQVASMILQRIRTANPSISDKALLNILDKQDQEKGEYALILTRALEYIKSTSTRSNGVGSASLSKDEVEALMENQNRLLKLFKEPTDKNQRADFYFEKGVITDEFVEDLWSAMPSSYRNRLNNKGSVAEGHFWGNDGPTLHGTADRGKLILKKFLEQDAKDAYTGLPISLFNSDLEHIVPYGLIGSKAEMPDNMCLISKSVNQTKKDKSMRKFFEEDVKPKANRTDEEWAREKEKSKKGKSKKSQQQELATELARHPEMINKDTIKAMGSKSYYILRELGITNYYWPSSGSPLQSDFVKLGAMAYAQSTDKETRKQIKDIYAQVSYRMSAKSDNPRSSNKGLGQSKEQVWNEYLVPELEKLNINTNSIIQELNIKGY